MTTRDSCLAVLVAVLWGINFVVIDWGMTGIPPLLFVAIRFVFVVFPAVLIVPRPQAPWRTVVAIGLFMSLGQFGLLYLAMASGLSPGLAALVLQAQVIFTVVIAAGVLRERPTATQAVGVVVGTAGLVVVALGRGGSSPLMALLICLGAALSWGVGNVLARASGIQGGLSVTVWSGLVVPVPALLLALAADGPARVAEGLAHVGWPALLATLYTAGLASLVGYGIFTTLLGRNAPAAVVPWILLVPPVAMTAAWLLIGSRPTGGEVVGGLVMLAGVAIALRPARTPVSAGAASESAALP